jgi:hypothetical protein
VGLSYLHPDGDPSGEVEERDTDACISVHCLLSLIHERSLGFKGTDGNESSECPVDGGNNGSLGWRVRESQDCDGVRKLTFAFERSRLTESWALM